MRRPYSTPPWKTAPLLRLLLPLMAGIILQWYLQFPLVYILFCIGCFMVAFLLIYLLPITMQFLVKYLQGCIFHLAIASIGMLLTWQKDVRHYSNWYGHHINDSSTLVIKMEEPPLEKSRSYKADASIFKVVQGTHSSHTSGKVLIYFSKDSGATGLHYGDYILVKKKLQPITNSGNPGAFNYKRYAAFQLLHHQLFLKKDDWVVLPQQQVNPLKQFLFSTRAHVVSILHTYIGNDKQQLGIAEALLIGYKEDLDKDLVQAYSNTGVVHIIAISGLHLGLIFVILGRFVNLLPGIRKSRFLKVMLLLAGLWLFALITGAAASVLRSAVMFSVVVIGTHYFKKSSVYNSLAASALILLCYNPYYLWDVGFQLSYLAVGGIVLLQPRIYRLYYPPNYLVRKTWELVSVTLAAQVAAFPICLYYFHQFPIMFLATNLFVLPMATGILYGGIVLIIVSILPPVASLLGQLLTLVLGWMNSIIHFFNSFSFSVWDGIHATMFTTWSLYIFITSFLIWVFARHKTALVVGLLALLVFAGLHLHSRLEIASQKKMIVYNISKLAAVDFIDKDQYRFFGDTALTKEGLQQNFHLKPARIFFGAGRMCEQLSSLQQQNLYWQFYNLRMIWVDKPVSFPSFAQPKKIDVLLLSKNAKVHIKDLLASVQPDVVVLDASNNLWKIAGWKKECEQLLLRCHAVSEQGAFVLNAH